MQMTASRADPKSPQGEPAPLAMEGIGYSIGGRRILSDVSLTVAPREIVCLLGPSGCGKTTLLRIAAGIERQDEGTVRIAGTVVADRHTFVPAEARKIGFVFQDLALFPHLRVADNVLYGLSVKARGPRQASEALAHVGLEGYERAYPHQLSGGQQQRVALTRALLPAPRVVLFDEPFSGLDRGLRDTVREDTVRILRERQATAVIVTHDPEEALAMADRIALMREGRIVQTATPEEIWRWPVDLEAARVFSSLNSFTGRVEGGIVETPVGRVPVGAEREGERLVVAFRPEALRVFPVDRGAGVEATVEQRRFFGTHVEIVARVGEVVLKLRADPYLVPHAETVRVVPDLRQAIILPVGE
ncbi:ABC transporter ATP-binding protein [Acuticoccus mangrovi]|uniref:ABC transporter ATP-binding protein n=1 Tax=Acuticoccus mangrovi TaxID=2796142 RepID=A0A934MLN0_9HYPH|nr:ABC transporter ATP-binding protein [Acuticoccus mangrovi]MBJ3776519.1 ABC transporter ATP-binding protein [Acuticoccus mangrovi]